MSPGALVRRQFFHQFRRLLGRPPIDVLYPAAGIVE